MAIALGIVAAAGMTVSEGLNSGQLILPQTRVEWQDNIEYAATIALSFIAGSPNGIESEPVNWRPSSTARERFIRKITGPLPASWERGPAAAWLPTSINSRATLAKRPFETSA